MTAQRKLNGNAVSRLGKLVGEDNAALGLLIDQRYRVDLRLARGGMGTVFQAHDTRLDRPVALKIVSKLKPALADRFRLEAKTMSRIEHPGIVPVHDLGTFPDGRLYYTMKYISGRTLDDLLHEGADRKRLLEILMKICDVVQHAHRHSIIHRDLKPANIMIDEHDQVYVLDWGIARVFAEMAGESDGTMIGTLHYMPPEQARGELESVDARSDVYSLGAILYEMLTGRPPRRGDRAEVTEAAKKGTPPAPPKDVPVDLATICMKALEADPVRRYFTVEDLQEDLRRHRDGEVIRAHPATLRYRLGKSLRRRKPVLVAGLVAAVLVAVILVPSLRKDRTSEDKRLEAQAILEKARPVIDQADLHYYRNGTDFTVWLEKVEAARGRIQKALNIDPDLVAGHYLLGHAWNIAGWDEKAERAWRRAVELDPEFAPARYHLGRLLLFRAYIVSYRSVQSRVHDVEESKKLIREAQGHLEVAMSRESGFADELQRTVASCMFAVMNADEKNGAVLLKEAIQKYGKRPGAEDFHLLAGMVSYGDTQMGSYVQALLIRPNHALAFFMLGYALENMQKYREAIATYDRAIAIRPAFADAFERKGRVYLQMRDFEKSIAAYTEALRISPDYSRLWVNRAAAHITAGEFDQAIDDCTQALSLDPEDVYALNNRGVAHQNLGDLEEAIRDYSEVIRILPGKENAWYNRARCWAALGEFERSMTNFNRALELMPTYAEAWNARGMLLMRLGRHDEAEKDFTRCIAENRNFSDAYNNRAQIHFMRKDWKRVLEDTSEAIRINPNHEKAYVNRGSTYVQLGRPDLAVRDFSAAIKIRPEYPAAYGNRGTARTLLRKFAGAMRDFDHALRIGGPDANNYVGRAKVRMELGKHAEAELDLNAALDLDPKNALAYLHRGIARFHQRRAKEALSDLNESIRMSPGDPQGYAYRAAVHVGLSQWDKGVADATVAIGIAREGTPVWYVAMDNRAMAYFHRRNHAEAIGDFNRAIPMAHPGRRAFLLHYRAASKNEMKDFDGAIEDESQAVKIAPNYADAYMMRSLARENAAGLARDGKKDLLRKALEDIEKALSLPGGTFDRNKAAAAKARVRQKLAEK